jgi:HNH endonuclease
MRYIRGHNTPRRPWTYTVEDRGYKTACWIWDGAKIPQGYGTTSVDGRTVGVHRVAYERAHGPIPAGLEIDHLCRTRPCVRPEHLEPVTTAENQRRGLAAKLTATDVRSIRKLIADGWVQNDIARAFGLSSGQVSRIATRQRWADV